MRWSCRYSSSEMFYVDLDGDTFRAYLHHSPDSASEFSLQEFADGAMGDEIKAIFPDEDREAMQAAARERLAESKDD